MNCKNIPEEKYTGKEKSPLGLGYSAKGEPLNKIMVGKDSNYYYVILVKKTNEKKWKKINDLSEFLNNLNDTCLNTAYKPVVKKIETPETGIEQKFGGEVPFFIKGEKWPSVGDYHMTFFGQLKDPRKNNNILYRIFIMVDDEGICDDYWITKIELNDDNLKKQITIKKPKYKDGMFDQYSKEYKFKPYEIISWSTNKEVKSFEYIRKRFHVPAYEYGKDNSIYNELNDAYHESDLVPSSGVKVGGTPLSTQDQGYVQSYDFLQIEQTSYLPYMWGDAGIAHISEDCEFTWDCC